jgi:Ca-activated chloride channel homolog
MLIRRPGEKEIPLPLKHTAVRGEVAGYIATVHVTQQFENPYDTKIEAEYVFPLPDDAAVNDFVMTIGSRTIRGIIRERKEAEKIYAQARQQGYVASLLTQERPNLFTQKVANIELGRSVDVDIHYFNTLAYVDGWYEFVFPMVVGPRFNPPGSTAGVGAVAPGRKGISGQKTEVQYLQPGTRSGHDISVAVQINAGVPIEAIECNSHTIRKSQRRPEIVQVELDEQDSVPNKDFVLRFKVAGDQIKSTVLTHRDAQGGYFAMMVYPPENLHRLWRCPMEMIFVLDCSGSMSGVPIANAKEAIRRSLRNLEQDDTFQVISFSNSASALGKGPIPATPENIRKGLAYVDRLEGEGGTMMIEGIKAALDFRHDASRLRVVSFMTDGFIGNEGEILAAIHDKLGSSRIFSFGVGSSVNRYLLDRMAVMGKGAVAYIGLKDDSTQAVDLFYERISHPAMTDVEIDFVGMKVYDQFPSRLPDLFVGRPILVTGRFEGNSTGSVTLRGKIGGHSRRIDIPVISDEYPTSNPGIAAVWARKKIESLAMKALADGWDKSAEIRRTALTYNLVSSYTAFVAVDSSSRTQGDHGITVSVPVTVPDGVRYDTTVQE